MNTETQTTALKTNSKKVTKTLGTLDYISYICITNEERYPINCQSNKL